MINTDDPTPEVLAACTGEGFALAGVCAVEPSDHAEAFRAWLEAGRHGSMDYLADTLDLRLDPARLLDGARSIVVVADQYASRNDAPDEASSTVPRGRVARYARGDDYHRHIKRRLHRLCDALRARFPTHTTRAFSDTLPMLEREHAARAGLGWIGRHSLLINPRLGSYLVLGGFLTTLPLTPTPESDRVADACGSCTRCIDACPTNAITDRSVDASRCIAYLTIERRGPIDERFRSAIGEWVFGCDVCQEVCPHNTPRSAGADVGTVSGAYAPRHASLDLLSVLEWTGETRTRELRRSVLKRATLAMIKRNAIIAVGNAIAARAADDPWRAQATERLRTLADDASEGELVRGTARSTLASVGEARGD